MNLYVQLFRSGQVMPRHWLGCALGLVTGCALRAGLVHAQPAGATSVREVVAAVLDRLCTAPERSRIAHLDAARAEALLTPQEKVVLSTDHIRFRINQRALITVLRDKSLGGEPFWLRQRTWRQQPTTIRIGGREFDRWEKHFEAGLIGLGVNSLKGGGRHYFVTVAPAGAKPLVIDELFPDIRKGLIAHFVETIVSKK
jgi:hypothetical protein